MPRDVLAEAVRKLKARSAWLASEEQQEYKRAKLLNVMGAPCCSPIRGNNASEGLGADADAFCSQVLGGCCDAGGGAADGDAAAKPSALQLERLEMPAELPFLTPADAGKTKARAAARVASAAWPLAAGQLPAGSQQGAAAAIAIPALTPVNEPLLAAAAGGSVVIDHQISRISPDSQAEPPPQQQQPGRASGGRARQTTLLPNDK
jgi:hypothetical protein